MTYQGARKAAGRSHPNPAAGGRIFSGKIAVVCRNVV
nr:MAG TPA: hypothetical protein [Caudoviricetes sp.]